MTAGPKWLTTRMVLAIHDEQLAVFGGAQGLRDPGLLDSALAKARDRYAYEGDAGEGNAGIFRLAAAYCAGIVRNHPFVDGNKRTGLLSLQAFLALNGYRFRPAQEDEVEIILALAAGEVDETGLARWIEANAEPA